MLKFFKIDIRLCMEQSKGYEDGMSTKIGAVWIETSSKRME